MGLDTSLYLQTENNYFSTATTAWLTTMDFKIATLEAAAALMSILVENGYEASLSAETIKKKTMYVISVTQTGVNK